MTPTQFIDSLPEARRRGVRKLHQVIRKNAPGLRPRVEDNGLAYGHFHYRYPSGREGDSPVIAVASRKQAISVYVMATRGTQFLPEVYADRLGTVNCGKSCVRIRNLDGVNLDALAAMVREAAELHASKTPQPRLTHKSKRSDR